jgi:hypothetical protein
MNPFNVNFSELYQRHLCRHSQYGNNVVHLATEIGTYAGVFSLARKMVEPPWLFLVPVPYFLVLAFQVPMRVLLVCIAFVALFLAVLLSLPELPIWLSLGLIVICYFVQNWSHKLYDKAADMTEFHKKYPKGPALFVLLLVYELPLLLNYLCFDWKNWVDMLPAPRPWPAGQEEQAGQPVSSSGG